MKKPEDFPMPKPESENGIEEYHNPESVRNLIEKLNRARKVKASNMLERAIKSMDEKGLNVQIPEDVDDFDQLTEEQRRAADALNEEIEKILPKKNKHNK